MLARRIRCRCPAANKVKLSPSCTCTTRPCSVYDGVLGAVWLRATTADMHIHIAGKVTAKARTNIDFALLPEKGPVMTERCLCMLAAFILALAVGTGAFGAHGLGAMVMPARLAVWQTAVLYHLIHGVGLLALVALAAQLGGLSGNRLLRLAVWALLLGIMLFSGSLYLLVLTDTPWLGALTPIGGVAFILGWLAVALVAWRQTVQDTPGPG